MSYADFTLEKICNVLNLEITNTDLFPQQMKNTEEYALSTFFIERLNKGVRLATAIDNEKARSEFIVAPLLLELKLHFENKISIFSGIELNVNKEKGLNGVCDFLISKSNKQYILTQPIIALVEAKNGNISYGLGQCMSEMYAAQLYNQNNQNKKIENKIVYGIVTTGSEWKFLQLQNTVITVDNNDYYINDPGRLFAILVDIINQS